LIKYMTGGDINEKALVESFQKIKEDISRLNNEILQMKKEYKLLMQENISLKKDSSGINEEKIKKIIEDAIANTGKKSTFNDRIIKKVNRNKKLIIRNKILELASLKNISVPEIKEVVVDNEQMCSKATFYRYIDRMKARNLISEIEIEERKVVIKI
jgi:regulator of replication initiation timing